MKRIERIVCKVNSENFGDFKKKLNITDENLFELISLYMTSRDPKEIEVVLNSFSKELVYDVLYGSLNEWDLYELTIVNLKAPIKSTLDKNSDFYFESLEDYYDSDGDSVGDSDLDPDDFGMSMGVGLAGLAGLEDFGEHADVFDLVSNPNALPLIEMIHSMTNTTRKSGLEERNVNEPIVYNLKTIKDIIDVVDSENIDYFIHDFSTFLKSLLTLKASAKLSNEYLPQELKDELNGEEIKIEDLMVEPDLFEWVDDGKLNTDLAIEFVDPDTNEHYMDMKFKSEDGKFSLDVESKTEPDYYQKLMEMLEMLKSSKDGDEEDTDNKKDDV